MNKFITIFNNLFDIISHNDFEISDVINQIRSNVILKTNVESIRSGNFEKTQLPVIMWQGIFSSRQNDGLLDLSGLVCLDLDHVSPTLKKPISEKYPWVYCIFVSPSGNGLKVIVKCDDITRENYRGVVSELRDIVRSDFGIEVDPASETLAQGCFFSYDPDLYLNPGAEAYKYQGKKVGLGIDTINMSSLSAYFDTESEEYTESQYKILRDLDAYWKDKYTEKYQDGNRTKALFAQGVVLWRSKIPFGLALDYLKSQYEPTGISAAKVEEQLRNAYAKAPNTIGRELPKFRRYKDEQLISMYDQIWRTEPYHYLPENAIDSSRTHAITFYKAGICKEKTLQYIHRHYNKYNPVLEEDYLTGMVEWVYTCLDKDEYGSTRNKYLGHIKD